MKAWRLLSGMAGGQFPAAAPTPPPTTVDPYFSSVALLLHGDGATVSDSSSKARSPSSQSSDVGTRSANKKFGAGSIQGNSASPVLQYAASTDFDLAAAGTLEFWLYLDPATSGTKYWLANSGGTYTTVDGSGNVNSNGWGFFPGQLPIGEWVHLALSRDSSGVSRTFKNGKLVYTDNSSYNKQGSVPLGIFGIPGRSDLPGISGYIDEFRMTPGVARYTADFDLQTAPFPDSGPDLSKSARYWRMLFTTRSSGQYTNSSEIRFYDNAGQQVSATGKAYAGSLTYDDGTYRYPPANSFDNDLSTVTVLLNSETGDQYLQVDFGSAVSVAKGRFYPDTASSDKDTKMPRAFKLQYSANGSAWTDFASVTNAATPDAGGYVDLMPS